MLAQRRAGQTFSLLCLRALDCALDAGGCCLCVESQPSIALRTPQRLISLPSLCWSHPSETQSMTGRLAMAVAAGATTRINPPDEDQRPASAKHRFFLARKVLPKDGRSKKQIKRGTGEASRQSSSTSKEPSKTLAAQMGKPKLELRKRLGLLLDSPKSSWSAVAIQFMVIAVIILSVLENVLHVQ